MRLTPSDKLIVERIEISDIESVQDATLCGGEHQMCTIFALNHSRLERRKYVDVSRSKSTDKRMAHGIFINVDADYTHD
ncbi:MAG TPA: hypothetical protein VNG71_11905 [Pyrinomonadaceae bacterium]|nr:hypothetical protein [Pyrinomonadaceae bacterium]